MAPSSFDIKYILGIVRRRFPLFLIPFVIAAAVGTAVVMSLPAIYTSDAKILVESQQIPEDLVKSTVTAQAVERLQVIQQRVMTRENLLSLVDKFELFNSKAGASRSEVVDLMRSRIVFAPIDVGQSVSRRNERMTTAFAVEFSYESAETAMRVANELVTFIVEADVRSRTERASDTTKFLERETQRLATELAVVQNQLSEFKLQNNETLPEKLGFNMSLLERTERGSADLQRELLSNEEQQRLIKLEANVRASGGSPTFDPQEQLRKKLSEAKIDYEIRKAVLAEKHPEMRALKKAIAALEDEINKAAPTVDVSDNLGGSAEDQIAAERLQTLQKAQQVMLEQKVKFEDDAKKLRAIVVKTPETGADLAVLERRAAALQASVDDMSARYSQARLGERLEQDQRAEKFQVIEQPVMPQSPSKPNRPALLAGVLAAAFGLGAAASTAVELLDSTIRRSADVERQLRQRPLVVIPYITTRQELRRRRYRAFLLLLLLLAAAAIALLFVHLYYEPLDVLYYRLNRKLGL
jgi:polysaccharide biosynthesis transport protein